MEGISDLIDVILRYPDFFKNIGEQLWGFRTTFVLIVTFIGFFVASFSLLHLLKHGGSMQPSRGHLTAFLGAFAVGVLLVNLITWINLLTWTAFTDKANASVLSEGSIESVTGIANTGPEAALAIFASAVIMITGLFAIVKGTLVMKDISSPSPSQGASMGAALSYLLAGVISVNVTRFFV